MSYSRVSRVSLYATSAERGIGLVRPADAKPVKKILLVGDSRSSLFIPPFAAICRDFKCELQIYLGADWQQKVAPLAVSSAPDAVIVVHAEGACHDLAAWRRGNSMPFIAQACGGGMTAAGLAGAAARVWQQIQATK